MGAFPWDQHQPAANLSDVSTSTTADELMEYDDTLFMLNHLVEDDASDACNRQHCKQPVYLAHEDLCTLSRSKGVFEQIESQPHMSLSLPKPGATAGFVLGHAANVFERLHKDQYPMTFKFGITHSPYFRWHHRPYGYRHGQENFERMIVVYAAANPWGPAFLEAHLIERYGSGSAVEWGMAATLMAHKWKGCEVQHARFILVRMFKLFICV